MAKKYIIDLLVNADGSVKSVNGVKGVLGELKKTADNVTGGMITKFQNFGKSVTGAGKGLSGVNKALKVMKAALIATGIGAIVVAFGSLVTFLTSTQRGMDKVSKVTAALGATFDVLKDRISGIGEAVALFFSGKPSAAFDKLKDSVTGVTDEIIRETNAAYKLKDALIALEDTEIGLIATTAKRRKEIAQARLAAEDETLSFTERIAALDKAAALETEILEEQLRIARERAQISEEQLALGESSREDIRANEEAQARVFQLEERSLLLRKSLSTRRNALVRQEKAEDEKLRQSRQVTSVMEGVNLKQGLTVKTEIAKQDVEITKKTEKAKQEFQLESLSGIAQLLGESSAFGKGLAIAQAVRDTYAGATKAYAQGGILGFIGAASIVAAGLANVRAITATKTPSPPAFAKGGRGAPTDTSSVSASAPQPPAFNIVGASGTNQLAEAIGGQAQQPVKAYVVSNDVSTAQELDRNIVEGASIG